jgi:hypothetical protein
MQKVVSNSAEQFDAGGGGGGGIIILEAKHRPSRNLIPWRSCLIKLFRHFEDNFVCFSGDFG